MILYTLLYIQSGAELCQPQDKTGLVWLGSELVVFTVFFKRVKIKRIVDTLAHCVTNIDNNVI